MSCNGGRWGKVDKSTALSWTRKLRYSVPSEIVLTRPRTVEQQDGCNSEESAVNVLPTT
jgi:hypothetical protein